MAGYRLTGRDLVLSGCHRRQLWHSRGLHIAQLSMFSGACQAILGKLEACAYRHLPLALPETPQTALKTENRTSYKC